MGQSNNKEKEVQVQLQLQQQEKFLKEVFTFLVISWTLKSSSLAYIEKETGSNLKYGNISFLLNVCNFLFGNRSFAHQLCNSKINEIVDEQALKKTCIMKLTDDEQKKKVAYALCSSILKEQVNFYERVSSEFDKFNFNIKKKTIIKEENIQLFCNFLLQTESDTLAFKILQEAIPIRRGYDLCAIENIITLAPCSSEMKREMLKIHTSFVKRLNFTKEYEKLNASELMDDLECRKYLMIIFPITLIDIIASYDVKRSQDVVNRRLMTLS